MEEPYSSKSDIWSLAYGLLWNVIQLDTIYRKDSFSTLSIYSISDQVKDVLLKMLEPNDDKWIGWKDLLEHPINKWNKCILYSIYLTRKFIYFMKKFIIIIIIRKI